MTNDQPGLAGFDGLARLFPLPNLVLFPNVVQGLHIFEPRYRQMTADALAGDGLITLALLSPGWDDDGPGDAPAIEGVGCVGKIVHHERLPDGRYNLRLKGVARVRLVEEVTTDKLYRVARAEPMADVVPDDLARLAKLRRTLADVVLGRFEPKSPARRHLAELFQGEAPLGQVCDLLAYALPLPVELKQALLAEPRVDARAEALTVGLADADDPEPAPPPAGRKFPPEFSPN